MSGHLQSAVSPEAAGEHDAARRRNVAILVYDQVEVLDFAGPFEVFSVADELSEGRHFRVFLVAERDEPVTAVNGLRVLPDFTFGTSLRPDIVVVPGGTGSRWEMENPALRAWIQYIASGAELILSVCSGARILAKAGLLSGRAVATHHQVVNHLRELAPDADVRPNERVMDAGKVVSTGGISAGIDGSFHVVERLLGEAAALRTADYMEYDWRRGSRMSPAICVAASE